MLKWGQGTGRQGWGRPLAHYFSIITWLQEAHASAKARSLYLRTVGIWKMGTGRTSLESAKALPS